MAVKTYSESDKKYLKEHFQTTRNCDMAKKLGRSADAVRKKMQDLGLFRSPEEVKAIRKQPNAGMYKPGNVPKSTKYDGYERINIDGYTEVRVSRGNFRLKHHLIWEKSNGPIPEGYMLCFKDGNKQHFALDNLELINNAALIRKNYNREKQAETLKKTWSRYFYLDQMGIKRGWYRNK